jgi:PHD/YefM family antitoxin component YafN of YafNO toxin-antitoxin module
MKGIDALQSVRFFTRNGKRFAVLSVDDWQRLIECLETLEDLQIVRQALAELKNAKGSPKRAGWLKWDDVKAELK